MKSISTISKVVPLESQVKYNNFLNKSLTIIKQIKYLIYVKCMLGINRLYLLPCKKIFLYTSYLYASFIIFSTLYYVSAIAVSPNPPAYILVQGVMCLEYILLIINSLLTKKKKMHNYFKNLSKFDQTLKVSSDHEVLNASKGSLIWILVTFTYNAGELCIFLLHVFNYSQMYGYLNIVFYYAVSLGHDMEQIFFFTLLRTIFTRLQLLKAHVRKAFRVNDGGISNMKTDKIETLSNNAQLDIGSLHKVYELLHKCSYQLNSIMSFPMLMILFSSGFATTMLLKGLVRLIQTHETLDPKLATVAVIYLVVRCVKYTLYVVMPCYYSSITSSQVASIRTTLYDSLNTMPLEKLERRRVKAFFLLTKESEFVYALAGLIRLNMTLPLSYTSLCTTYLVIIIQFSKFLD